MQSVILGTAQWGLAYGATNTTGRLADDVVLSVARIARGRGIHRLDTAPGYGDSEARVGQLAPGFGVQTKVSAQGRPAGHVRSSVEASMQALRLPVLDAVLVHDWTSLDPESQKHVANELEILRGERLVSSVGVSGYDEADLASALSAFGTLDVVQVPVSVLDQRLDGCRLLAEVRARGGRVQARSILLQGAALAGAGHPAFGTHPDVRRLRAHGDPLSLCLGFVASRDWIDEVVVGATSEEELGQVMDALAAPMTGVDWSSLASSDAWLVDPRRWTAPTREG